MATRSKVASKTTGKKPATPAQVLREQKAKIEEASKVEIPRLSGIRHPASDAAEATGKAIKHIGAIHVPMTLAEVCDIMGADVRAENFAATAFEALAGQLNAVSSLAEHGGSYDAWRVVENIAARMKCAGDVVTWLEADTTELPEVTP